MSRKFHWYILSTSAGSSSNTNSREVHDLLACLSYEMSALIVPFFDRGGSAPHIAASSVPSPVPAVPSSPSPAPYRRWATRITRANGVWSHTMPFARSLVRYALTVITITYSPSDDQISASIRLAWCILFARDRTVGKSPYCPPPTHAKCDGLGVDMVHDVRKGEACGSVQCVQKGRAFFRKRKWMKVS